MKKVKRKRCRICNELFSPFRTTQVVCSLECSLELVKINKKEDEKQRAKDNEMIDGLIKEKKERESLTTALNSTKTVVHRYIHLRDEGKPCITCGTPYKKDFDAGHFYPTKFSSLRFDLDNIHCQCIKCNRHKEGEHDIYHTTLPDRIGQKKYDSLVKRAKLSKKFTKKWTRTELSNIRKEVRELIKKLQ